MNQIEYGFKDEQGNNIIDTNPTKWDNEFPEFYYLLTPEELLERKCGVCWDQVELERKLFEEKNIKVETYFVFIADQDRLPSHTFLIYEDDGKYYWFEHSWNLYIGIHEYENKSSLLLDVIDHFKKSHPEVNQNAPLYLYEYKKPKEHITCDEFYQYIETQKRIELN